MKNGGASGVGAAKSTEFDYSFAFNDKENKEVKEKDFRDFPPIFTAFSHGAQQGTRSGDVGGHLV